MPTLRTTLRQTTPPTVRDGGTRDTNVSAMHGAVRATITIDAHDRGEVRLDGSDWTVSTSGLITDLLAIEDEHGPDAAADAAIALCKAITGSYSNR